jgi:hypothetical protein
MYFSSKLATPSFLLYNLQGRFMSFFGKNFTADEMAKSISENIKRWQEEHKQAKQ